MTGAGGGSVAVADAVGPLLAEAWPGTTLVEPPRPLAGGFWATMHRLCVADQPPGVPAQLVLRVAPDPAVGAKELAVQRTLADLGFPTPAVRLAGSDASALGGTWSVMDFAPGVPPLGGLDGAAALRGAPVLLSRLPHQLADPMARLHALDPTPVTAAVNARAPTVAWTVDDLLAHFESVATGVGDVGLALGIRRLAARRPAPGGEVVCHGDLHPFNLLVDPDGATTVIDWTGALLAQPAFDVAYTSLMVANPPLDAPRPLDALLDQVGARIARRFVADYRTLAPAADLSRLGWFQGLHGARMLVEQASMLVDRPEQAAAHPFAGLRPVAEWLLRRAGQS